MNRGAFDGMDAAVAGSLKQGRIQIKAGNALGCRLDWQRDDFGSVENARRINSWIGCKAHFSHQRTQQAQRLRRYKLPTDFMSRELVFFQQQPTPDADDDESGR